MTDDDGPARARIGRALDQKGSLIRIPGDRSANLRSLLRQAGGDAEALDSVNADLHRLTATVSLAKTVGDELYFAPESGRDRAAQTLAARPEQVGP